MFNSRILFIVGAGASDEAGLPTGNELKSKLAKKIDIRFEEFSRQVSGDRSITEALRLHTRQSTPENSDINPYLHAAWMIRDAMPQALSIDNFIDAHRSDSMVELCGKLGIAKVILEAEHSSKLFIDDLASEPKLNYDPIIGTWYLKFWQLLHDNVGEAEVEKIFDNVAIITFNYDRCIEHFLACALQTHYVLPPDKAYDLVNRLTILHPYGVTGRLPWQASSAKGIPFGARCGGANLLDVAGQIKTFTERIKEEKSIADIRQQVRNAETIVFLGFAFHATNMELLRPGEEVTAKRVFATAYGISENDCREVEDDILTMLNRKAVPINMRSGLRCSKLFDEYWRTLSRA